MPDNSEPFIVIDNVTKKFDGTEVLKGISTEIRPGEVLGLIGRSGSGKSVLIHMLRGSPDYRPDEGTIIYRIKYCESCGLIDLPDSSGECTGCGGAAEIKEIDFWNLDDRDPMKLAIKQRIAIMLQRTFALFGDMTVIENIFESLGEDMEEDEKVNRAIELLKMVDLTYRTMHIARDLSGGEKQRCVLARQLAKNPILFLADEPTGTLDPSTAETVHDTLVKSVEKTNMTMVVTSHWPEAIDRLSNRAIWLGDGEIYKEGDPKEIAEEFVKGTELTADRKVPVGEPIIRVKNAKKYFYSIQRGVVKAVDDVTFDVKEKEIFGLVGLSGAGKTTLSKMIAGLLDAKLVAGRIEKDGSITVGATESSSDSYVSPGAHIRIGDTWVNMSEYGPTGRGRATPYIGMLHQEYSLYPFDTILQNLTVCIGMKMPAELAKMKAVQVLKGVGFKDSEVERILYTYPDYLSVGEKQRVALAQVLIKEPRIVILDEPTGTLDPRTKMDVVDSVLSSRRELGQTFLVVSHDMDFVMNCCDRAALMKDGKIVTMGEPGEIVDHLSEKEEEVMLRGGVEA
ncbi:MAG: methyl coenzyme M reductase system, component A2 [Methanomassiliicoccales archaeon]